MAFLSCLFIYQHTHKRARSDCLVFFFVCHVYIVIALPPFSVWGFILPVFYELSHKMSSMAKSSLQINEFLIVTRYFFYQRFFFSSDTVCLFIFIFAYKSFFPSSVSPTLRVRFFFHIKSRKFFTLKRVDSQILMFDLVSHLSCGLILNFFFIILMSLWRKLKLSIRLSNPISAH